jgi:hypothetical protein
LRKEKREAFISGLRDLVAIQPQELVKLLPVELPQAKSGAKAAKDIGEFWIFIKVVLFEGCEIISSFIGHQ